MGLPQIMINFSNAGASAIRRSARGSVALIVSGDGETITLGSIGKAEAAGLDSDTLALVRLCFMGYPMRVTLIYGGDTAYEALALAEKHSAGGWICAPGLAQDTVAGYIKQRRKAGAALRAVVANAAAPDCEGVVNVCTGDITAVYAGEAMHLTAEEYTARVAGILAGLSLSQSATYLALPEIVDFEESLNPDEDIDAGKLIICRGADGARLGRAVTSLTTVTSGTSPELKKIKIAEAVDMIKADIAQTFEKDYIGKAINDYDSKLLLVTAVNGYLASLEGNVLDRSYDNRAFVDYEAQSVWLQSQGVDTEQMSDTEILTANTDSQVFLAANIKFVDAMEDITFIVSM